LPPAGATRLDLSAEERFQQSDAGLEIWQRVEAKLDALSDALIGSGSRSFLDFHHASAGKPRAPPDDHAAWRAALLQRGRAAGAANFRDRAFDQSLSETTASTLGRRLSAVGERAVPRGRKSVSIMEGHTDMRLRDLHDSPNDQTKLTKLTNGGRKLSIGSSADSVNSVCTLHSAAQIVPTSSPSTPAHGARTSDGSGRSKKDVLRDANEELGHRASLRVGQPPKRSMISKRSARSILSGSLALFDGQGTRGSMNDEVNIESKKEMQKKLQRKFTALNVDRSDRSTTLAWRIVQHPHFDACIMLVVFVNALLIGAAVQHSAVSSTETDFFEHAEYVCTVIFLIELGLRIWVYRSNFFTDRRERAWNLFDSFLVSISVIDAVVNLSLSVGGKQAAPSSAGFLGKLLRIIRVARIMRILRTVRFLSQLRIITFMIVSSTLHLFWIFVILAALIYVFAIILTQGATEHMQGSGVRDEGLSFYFGTLFTSMYTLFKAMSGGVNWADVSDAMTASGGGLWPYEVIFCAYMFFCLFAVINIVTGVFVDGAIELAKRDRTALLDKMFKDNETQQAHLLGLVQALDQDGDESITAEEFKRGLQKPEVRDFISAMQVEISDAEKFFAMLDEDGSGEVDLVEFVTGMQRLRGEAKSVDIHMMLHENRKMLGIVSGLVDVIGEDHLKAGTASDCGSPRVVKQLSRGTCSPGASASGRVAAFGSLAEPVS